VQVFKSYSQAVKTHDASEMKQGHFTANPSITAIPNAAPAADASNMKQSKSFYLFFDLLF